MYFDFRDFAYRRPSSGSFNSPFLTEFCRPGISLKGLRARPKRTNQISRFWDISIRSEDTGVILDEAFLLWNGHNQMDNLKLSNAWIGYPPTYWPLGVFVRAIHLEFSPMHENIVQASAAS